MASKSSMDTDDRIAAFAAALQSHAERKRELYDGVGRTDHPDVWLRYAIEELGEIASALTRQRYMLAIKECIDVAHCAMLLSFAIEQLTEDLSNGE